MNIATFYCPDCKQVLGQPEIPQWVDLIKRAKRQPITDADREHILKKLPEIIETAEVHAARFQREAAHARHWLDHLQGGDALVTIADMEADLGEVHWKLRDGSRPWLPSLLAAWKIERAHLQALVNTAKAHRAEVRIVKQQEESE
jgi:hypothetical protein